VAPDALATQEPATTPEGTPAPAGETTVEPVTTAELAEAPLEAATPQEQGAVLEGKVLEETVEDGAVKGETAELVAEADEPEGEEWDEEDGEDGKPKTKDHRKRDRKRQLEFDERLGQVVARKKRKPGRDRKDWGTDEY
jgi:hypothetical protein